MYNMYSKPNFAKYKLTIVVLMQNYQFLANEKRGNNQQKLTIKTVLLKYHTFSCGVWMLKMRE